MNNPNKNHFNNLFHFDSDEILHSEIYDDIYFSTSGAEAESEHVFIDGNNLKERFKYSTNFAIAEAGFGTGLNFLKTIQEWSKHFNKEKNLVYIGFEAFPLPIEVLKKSHDKWPTLKTFSQMLLNVYNISPEQNLSLKIPELNITLNLIIGDINETIINLNTYIDAWFLDGFSPAKNPQMWSSTLFKGMKKNSKHQLTTIATYSCAKVVREGLSNNNFKVIKDTGFGKKKFMLKGTYY